MEKKRKRTNQRDSPEDVPSSDGDTRVYKLRKHRDHRLISQSSTGKSNMAPSKKKEAKGVNKEHVPEHPEREMILFKSTERLKREEENSVVKNQVGARVKLTQMARWPRKLGFAQRQ